jgi:SNF2 family DNA or RNA helicase
MLVESQLHGYQKYVNQVMDDLPFCALFLEMGLGKTVCGLTLIRNLINRMDVRKVLIVAPRLVAKKTWPDEVLDWDHTKFLTYDTLDAADVPEFTFPGWDKLRLFWMAAEEESVLPLVYPLIFKCIDRQIAIVVGKIEAAGDAFKKLLNNPSLIHTISVDNFPRLVRLVGVKHWPYDTVILDESDGFASHSSGRFKAVRAVRHKIDRLIELTGTPTGNKGFLDLWAQITLLDGGDRLGRTLSSYQEKYFIKSRNGFKWELRPGAQEKIMELISDIAISMRSEDYLKLPPMVPNTIKVTLPGKAREDYKEFEREFLLEWEDGELDAASEGVKINKLLQMANGAVYYFDEDEKRLVHEIHEAKLDALERVFAEANGESVLVAYNFKHDRDRIKKRFPQVIDFKSLPDTQDRWNRRELPLVMAHPKSIGHGLNLQKGGRIIVWFGLSWDLRLWQQFNKRLHRQGQKETVFIHRIVCEDTADERVIKILDAAGSTQADLKEGLKADMTRRMLQN